MSGQDLVDYSLHESSSSVALDNASNLVLIDNYDSFTWNIYQYLVLEGASVTVYRNDKVTINELIAQNPTQLVISPGPGHPDRDSGISREAIKYFSGKIPVLGICMGQQCMLSVFGGEVVFAGEILHGKTSPLRHDSKGVYKGIDQDIPVTRYHSLAGTYTTIPDCLEVSSWVGTGSTGPRGVIMGVRHKIHTTEGVQFHPESILTAHGHLLLKNFLKIHGGKWDANKHSQITTSPDTAVIPPSSSLEKSPPPKFSKADSILDEIYANRKLAVAAQMSTPSQRQTDLQVIYDLGLCPPQISLSQRLRQSSFPLSLMAEIKRASPSKGTISLSACAPAQARAYAHAGASVISVLTEPVWFKGDIEDLRAVRSSLNGIIGRPAVLRKDFIFNEYQILEARIAGADSVLLIVKMLDEALLTKLYRYSISCGMEPLVEVNNEQEMHVAIKLGSKVIGVNNRNLTNFSVDLDTTSNLMKLIPNDTIVCALSGISGPADVEAYKSNGVSAVLVGEALMRASNITSFIHNLLGEPTQEDKCAAKRTPLVKICGVRTTEAAKAAVMAGANLIGIILAEGRKRTVRPDRAIEISQVVHQTYRENVFNLLAPGQIFHDFYELSKSFLSHPTRSLLVGVFQNQPLSYVVAQQKLLELDIVQLHGSEPIEWASFIPVPVIKRIGPGEIGVSRSSSHTIPLLDSAVGGSGETLDLNAVSETLKANEGLNIILAGGLDPSNLQSTFNLLGDLGQRVLAVDVSSGVEKDGIQDLEKIKSFVTVAKGLGLQ
ncbi:MAG: bifunctional tryptophan synthase trp1 [Trizodia sp. TS-e1964]|nr:MAG: bifunctional tryptophan synthase trp1 [Trizodia sp. TS-e1964]